MSQSLEYAIERENWNIYRLVDGTTLRIRLVMTRVGCTGKDERGAPLYTFDHAIVAQVEPAETVSDKCAD